MPGIFVNASDLSLTVCVSTTADWNTTLQSSAAALKPTEWTHVAVACAANRCALFVDGTLDGAMALPAPPLHNGRPFHFGKCPPGVKTTSADYPGFSGRFCGAYHARRCFSPSEVARLAASRVTAGLTLDLRGLPPVDLWPAAGGTEVVEGDHVDMASPQSMREEATPGDDGNAKDEL